MSSTDSENTEPNLLMPSNATVEPRRDILLTDNEEPTVALSMTDSEAAIRAKLRMDKDAPR
jgi:hypothetical protein